MRMIITCMGIILYTSLNATEPNNTPPQPKVRVINNNKHTITQSYYSGTPSSDNPQRTVIIQQQPKASSEVTMSSPNQPDNPYSNNNNHVITQNIITLQPTPPPARPAPQAPVHTTPTPYQPLSMIAPQIAQSSLLGSCMAIATQPAVVAGSVLACYGLLLAQLYYRAYALSDSSLWSAWKQEVPISAIHHKEQQYAQELFAAVQERYAHKPDFASFLSPLCYFMQDVDNELHTLARFLQLHSCIDYLKLTPLFPAQEDMLSKAAIKIERLAYLKDLLLNWVKEYKTDRKPLRYYLK